MRLTRRGRDYLAASIAGTLVATVLDTKIVLALCFTMVFAALISRVVLSRSSGEYFATDVQMESTRCFKGEEIRGVLRLNSLRDRFVKISLTEISLPNRVAGQVTETMDRTFEILLRPKFVGRSKGLSAKFEFEDPLGLFLKTVPLRWEEFTIDCCPRSLLFPVAIPRPISIYLGEREGKTSGLGMEFYSIDEYNPSTERRSIYWKKVATLPDEKLLVKTRATNIKGTISLSLILTDHARKDSLEWLDSACEGIALIGKTIIGMGCKVELLFNQGGLTSRAASDLAELSEAVLEMSLTSVSTLDGASLLLSKADICVTGFGELQNDIFASAIARKPTLLIEDVGWVPARISELALVYRPFVDVGRLVGRVVGI